MDVPQIPSKVSQLLRQRQDLQLEHEFRSQSRIKRRMSHNLMKILCLPKRLRDLLEIAVVSVDVELGKGELSETVGFGADEVLSGEVGVAEEPAAGDLTFGVCRVTHSSGTGL